MWINDQCVRGTHTSNTQPCLYAAFNYLTYKPGIDILTESQQYRLCLDLLDEGYTVYCMDDAIIHLCDDRILFEDPKEEVYWINL